MNKLITTDLSILLALTAIYLAPVFAQTVDTYTRTENTIQATPTSILNSWMTPTVVRQRDITKTNGEIEHITEPLIMERHELVAKPIEKTTTTTTTTEYRDRATTGIGSTFNSKSVGHTTAHRLERRRVFHQAHNYRHMTVANEAAKRCIARRIVTGSLHTEPLHSESTHMTQQTETTVEKSVILERPDPALSQY